MGYDTRDKGFLVGKKWAVAVVIFVAVITVTALTYAIIAR